MKLKSGKSNIVCKCSPFKVQPVAKQINRNYSVIKLVQSEILKMFVNIQFKTGRKPCIFPLCHSFAYIPPTSFLIYLFVVNGYHKNVLIIKIFKFKPFYIIYAWANSILCVYTSICIYICIMYVYIYIHIRLLPPSCRSVTHIRHTTSDHYHY